MNYGPSGGTFPVSHQIQERPFAWDRDITVHSGRSLADDASQGTGPGIVYAFTIVSLSAPA